MINQDYRRRLNTATWTRRLASRNGMIALGSAFCVLGALTFSYQNTTAPRAHSKPFLNETSSTEIEPPTTPLAMSATTGVEATQLTDGEATASGDTAASDQTIVEKEISIKLGDTLSSIFSALRIPPQTLAKVLASGKDARQLLKIKGGEKLLFTIAPGLQLTSLRYDLDFSRQLVVEANGEQYKASIETSKLEIQLQRASANIDSSLFAAAQEAGLADNITLELAKVFGWDIDFALDIRKGDSFAVLYEEMYRDGIRVKNGAVVAAEFTNQGKTYRAIRYRDSQGRIDYYAPDGRALRKTFFRTPVDFTRISSTFSLGRYHPLLNRIRAHKGVDYAAPTGTPVKATADGRVGSVGSNAGYGNVIVLSHGKQYSTLYAHLSRFARGIHNGSPVKQGEVIGYVGQTGLATGPHLHYEFRVNGVHRNPLSIKTTPVEPLPARELAAFLHYAKTQLATLTGSTSQDTLALNDHRAK